MTALTPRSRVLALTTIVSTAGVLPVLLFVWLYGGASSASGVPPCPFRLTEELGQAAVLVTALVMKPAYMLLSLALIVLLWRRASHDIAALRWGLIFFLSGEVACMINYLFLAGKSDLWEYLHDYGMVVGFSFIAWAVLEGLDRRVFKFSDAKARCAALGLCVKCAKYDENVVCSLPRLFKAGLIALILIALLPLSVSVEPYGYSTDINGTTVTYATSLPTQLFMLRYCPILAAVLLAAAWGALTFTRSNDTTISQYLLAAALGPLGFSLLRLFLYGALRNELTWYTSWEEFTELLFILAVAFVLYVFRASLITGGSRATWQ